ncbi:MAG TPA: hypothetical protein VMV44_10095 [Rectinemataceae bacterium]|nr:hypothetical protein [Rectinemataceae bacterium]
MRKRSGSKTGLGRLSALSTLLLSLAIGSCSSGPPEILGVEWTTETWAGRPGAAEGGHESLAVFASVHDPDGIDDIEGMWVIEDGAELSWALDASSWTKRSLGGVDWLGAADLSMPDGSAPPPGLYRVLVSDFAGNRAEYQFKLEKGKKTKAPPRVSLNGNSLELGNPWPENYLLAYDAGGNLIRSAVMKTGGGSLASLVGSADAARSTAVGVYGYDPGSRSGAYSARMAIR